MLFEELIDNRVKQTNNSYIEMKGFMKIMVFVMKVMFKKNL